MNVFTCREVPCVGDLVQIEVERTPWGSFEKLVLSWRVDVYLMTSSSRARLPLQTGVFATRREAAATVSGLVVEYVEQTEAVSVMWRER